jgi:hypothetical protein
MGQDRKVDRFRLAPADLASNEVELPRDGDDVVERVIKARRLSMRISEFRQERRRELHARRGEVSQTFG